MTSGQELREQLGHPVFDSDGHWLEPVPVFLDFLRDELGGTGVDRFEQWSEGRQRFYTATPHQRLEQRMQRAPWWGTPSDTDDRATVMIPGMLHARLEEFGIDFALVYTTLGIGLWRQPDVDLRRASIRALNRMNAELFAPYGDRLAPAAVVSTNTPDEALDALEHAVGELGMKVVVVNGHNVRKSPDGRTYIDTLGLDSLHDYEPLWRRCVELGVAVTEHCGSHSDSPRRLSPTNFVFNHIGHFAEAMAANAKALFLGGVTRRHPGLKFAFLEGGVGFGCSLLLDLESHWEKRRVSALDALRPDRIDPQHFLALLRRFGDERMQAHAEDLIGSMELLAPGVSLRELTDREAGMLDEFAALGVETRAELRAEFTRSFYFGCEPDDLLTAVAFDARLGIGVKPIFGSDIGHFDVPDMAGVLHEAWELVERGLLTERDFEQFTFRNGVELHRSMNPRFFDDTCLATALQAVDA